MTVETATPATEAQMETVLSLFASIIAESRYNAWDSHAKGPNAMTWQEFRQADPATAEGIYLEDGRRDAEALLPYVRSALNRAAVESLHRAAANLLSAEHPSAAAVVLGEASKIDWRRPADTQEAAACGS